MSQSQVPALYNTSFFFREFVEKEYVCRIPADFKFEKVLEPEFWVHVGDMLKPDDLIHIRPDDRAYRAAVVVIDAGHLFAKVALLYKVDLKVITEDPAQLEVEMIGTKFRVRRGKAVLKDDLATKKDASRWVEDYCAKQVA